MAGRELAAILGATLAARHHGIPVLLDGFVCHRGCGAAGKAQPGRPRRTCLPPMSRPKRRIAGCSIVLGLPPLLDLNMRLGEGSGACLAVNVVRSAYECFVHMASFAEAGVSDK